MKKSNEGFGMIAGLLILVVLGLISFASWYVWHNKESKLSTNASHTSSPSSEPQPSTSVTPQKYPSTANWDDVKLSDADYKRKQDVQEIQFKMVVYKIKYQTYPASAQEASIVQEKDPLIDPGTKAAYKLVDTAPALGEMQYKLSTTCDSNNRNFESADSKNIYAFLIRLSEGSFICKSNIK